MNREIKFRFYDIDKKEYQKDGSVLLGSAGEPFSLVPSKGGYNVHIRNCVVEQFTGLTDKNGKEIYERDIINVKIFEYPNQEKTEKRSFNATVFYHHYQAFFGLCEIIDGKESEEYIIFNSNSMGLEVIGNIYENSELLNN